MDELASSSLNELVIAKDMLYQYQRLYNRNFDVETWLDAVPDCSIIVARFVDSNFFWAVVLNEVSETFWTSSVKVFLQCPRRAIKVGIDHFCFVFVEGEGTRAYICNYNEDNQTANLYYFDWGEFAERSVSDCFTISDSMMNVPPLALPFQMRSVSCGGKLANLEANCELQFSNARISSNFTILCDCFYSGQPFSDYITDSSSLESNSPRKYNQSTPENVDLKPCPISPSNSLSPEDDYRYAMESAIDNDMQNCSLIETRSPSFPPVLYNQKQLHDDVSEKGPIALPGEKLKIRVVNVVSPLSFGFTIINDENSKRQATLNNKLQSVPLFPLNLDANRKGLRIIVKFNDQNLQRALLLKTFGTNCAQYAEVRCIDTGEIVVVPMVQCFVLPSDICQIPCLRYTGALNNLKLATPDSMITKIFEHLTLNKTLNATLRSHSNGQIYYRYFLDVFSENGDSIKQILISGGFVKFLNKVN